MKNLAYGLVALLLLLLIVLTINGCTKSLNALPVIHLAVSNSTVKINQNDSLALIGAAATDSIKWSVIPAGSSSISTKNNGALIVFTKPGIYVVGVSDNGATPLTTSITVTGTTAASSADTTRHHSGDTVATPHTPVTFTTLPLTGDQITLVPHFYNNAAADTSYLYFVAQTKNYYCGTSTLETSYSLVNNNYTAKFLDVSQPSFCVIGNSPIAAVLNFKQNPGNQLPAGTFPLTVTLNGATYTGSIAATATTITFNWNYSSGVLISPKQISR